MSTSKSKSVASVVVSPVEPWLADVLANVRPISTIEEASALLRISTRNLRRLISLGRLHPLKVAEGGASRVLFARAELGRFLETMAAVVQ